jgi:hypothetical protein
MAWGSGYLPAGLAVGGIGSTRGVCRGAIVGVRAGSGVAGSPGVIVGGRTDGGRDAFPRGCGVGGSDGVCRGCQVDGDAVGTGPVHSSDGATGVAVGTFRG